MCIRDRFYSYLSPESVDELLKELQTCLLQIESLDGKLSLASKLKVNSSRFKLRMQTPLSEFQKQRDELFQKMHAVVDLLMERKGEWGERPEVWVNFAPLVDSIHSAFIKDQTAW